MKDVAGKNKEQTVLKDLSNTYILTQKVALFPELFFVYCH